MPIGPPRYCPDCGQPLTDHRVAGEPRNHWYCHPCEREVHNHPVIVATSFIGFGNSLLWVRRAIEPRKGLWAIPGGFVEHGEPLREGAARELYEEAGVVIPPDRLDFYMLGSLTFINQIYVGFRASVDSAACNPGRESLEAGFFTREQCPWDEVAYPEVNESVELAYDELESGRFHQWQVEMTANSYDRQMIHTGPLRS